MKGDTERSVRFDVFRTPQAAGGVCEEQQVPRRHLLPPRIHGRPGTSKGGQFDLFRSLICTGARRHPAMCGTNQSNKRRIGPPQVKRPGTTPPLPSEYDICRQERRRKYNICICAQIQCMYPYSICRQEHPHKQIRPPPSPLPLLGEEGTTSKGFRASTR